MEENLNQEKFENVKAEIKEKLKLQKQLEEFNKHVVAVISDLFKTDLEIQKEVSDSFYKAIAETGLTIPEVGKTYRNEMNNAFNDILKQCKTDRVLEISERNLITATLLNLYEPIDNFVKDVESRKKGLLHVYFINAALRSLPLRYNGCKTDWDLEDKKLKEVKSTLSLKN